MPFPQRSSGGGFPSGGDHMDVRDVTDDFKHWTPGATVAASARAGQVITRRGSGELRLLPPATRRRTRPRRCPRLPSRDTRGESRPSASGGDEADHCPDRDAHAADARLSTHYVGVTSDARQLRHIGWTPIVDIPLVEEPRPLANPSCRVMTRIRVRLPHPAPWGLRQRLSRRR